MAGLTPGAPRGDPARPFRIAALHRGVFGLQPARGSSPSGGPGAPQPGPGSEQAVSSAPPGRAAVLAALPGPAPRRFPPGAIRVRQHVPRHRDVAARASRVLPRPAVDRPLPAPPHTGRGLTKPHGAVRSGQPEPTWHRAAPASLARGPKQRHSGGPSPGVRYHGRHGVAPLPLALAAQPEPARPGRTGSHRSRPAEARPRSAVPSPSPCPRTLRARRVLAARPLCGRSLPSRGDQPCSRPPPTPNWRAIRSMR